MEREKSRRALKKANEELEARVKEKTADLARANKELQRESEKVKLFAYSVSHDLKTRPSAFTDSQNALSKSTAESSMRRADPL
jgi:light-regulated signal transduction histidine kinase (bacteriophytochrome)